MLQDVPDVTVKVVVTAQQEATALGEGHRRDATDDVVVRVHAYLLVRADVKQAARRVVRPSRKRMTVGEILKRDIKELITKDFKRYTVREKIRKLITKDFKRDTAGEGIRN